MPQCGTSFEGRSNQLYCNTTCKQRAFQTGKTRLAESAPTVVAITQHGNPLPALHSAIIPPVSATASLEVEKLRLEQQEVFRRWELEDRQRERQHEQVKQQRLLKQELDLLDNKNMAEQQQREAEQAAQKNQLKAQRQARCIDRSSRKEAEEPTESGSGGVGWVMAGVAGLILLNWAGAQPPKPVPAPKPTPVKKGLDALILEPLSSETEVKIDSKPDSKPMEEQ